MTVSVRTRVFIYTSIIFLITIILSALLFNITFLLDIADNEKLFNFDNISLIMFRDIVNIMLLFIALSGEIVIFLISNSVANNINKPVNAIITKNSDIAINPKGKKAIYSGNIKEIAELVKSTNALSERLAQQDDSRTEVASDYAHEFRTALTLLLSNLEAISDGIFKPTKEVIDSCKVEVMRLNDMSEYLYKIADFERYKFTIEKRRINLSNVVKNIIPLFNEYAKLKNVTINSDVGNFTCEADTTRVQSIIINLIMNAIKFSYNDSEINITLFRKSDNILNLTIEDKGVGIAKSDLPHIFKFGYRSHRKKGKHIYGSGIGLSIVKALVGAHRWRISVKTKVNVGTTFIVTIIEKRK